MSDFGELPLDRMIPSWLVCLQVDCNHQFVPSAFQVPGVTVAGLCQIQNKYMSGKKPQVPTVDKAQVHWTNHRGFCLGDQSYVA
jgi:hypothetical protein